MRTSGSRSLTIRERDVLPGIVFAFFFFFVLIYINPPAIYSCNGLNIPSFVRNCRWVASGQPELAGSETNYHHSYILELTPEYFRDCFATPGAPTGFTVTLVIYACHYAIAGAFVFTFLAWLPFFFFPALIRGMGGPDLRILHYAPVPVLLVICSHYEPGALAWLIPLTGVIIAAVIYQRISFHSTAMRCFVFSLLLWTTYYLFQWAIFIFFLLGIIHELFVAGNNRAKKVVTLLAAAAPTAAIIYFLETLWLPPERAMNIRNLFASGIPFWGMISYVPLAAMACHPAVTRRILPREFFRWSNDAPADVKAWCIRAALLVGIIGGITVWIMHDPFHREVRETALMFHYLETRQWGKILDEDLSAVYERFPERYTPLQMFTINVTDHALFQTGTLGSRLLEFPHALKSLEPLLLIKNSQLVWGQPIWIASMETFMDLGSVNFAERIIGDAIEDMGPYPYLLYPRALLQIAKGNREAAEALLNRLGAMPFYRKKARRLLRTLHDNTVLGADGRIARMVSYADTSDYLLFSGGGEQVLLSLLKSNPRNKMAYDYLMTLYLLNGQPEKTAHWLGCASDFGYADIPPYWQQAFCLYMTTDYVRFVKAPGPIVQPDIFKQFKEFSRMSQPYWHHPELAGEARTVLQPGFGRTYYFLYFLGNTRGGR